MSDSLPPDRANLDRLIEQLRSSSRFPSTPGLLVLVVAVCYGVIAANQGTQFLLLYLGVLVVVFTLQGSNETRNRKQIGLLVQILRELEEKSRQGR
jgi:hypothetical protein